DRLRRHQVQVTHEGEVDLAVLLSGRQGAVIFQDGLRLLRAFNLLSQILVLLGFLLQTWQSLFDGLQVRQNQLSVDNGDVRGWVDLAVNVDDILIRERTHDLTDGIGFADIREEGVAHAFAFRCALNDAGDIHEGNRRRQDALGAENFSKTSQARIRQFNQADIGLNGGERVIRSQDVRTGQGIK